MPRKGTDWSLVDWRLRDVEIAALVGVSKQRVWQARPKGMVAEQKRRHVGVTAGKRIGLIDTSGKTLAEVARAAGCGTSFARATLARLGKGYRRLPRGRARYDWGLMPENWRELTDKELAGMVGASSPAVVTQWRVRHGMRKRKGGA